MTIPLVPIGPYDPSEEVPVDTTTVGHGSLQYGPKRVKTPNMEVEQFDPRIIQEVQARENASIPNMHNLGWSVGVPNLPLYKHPRNSRTP